MKILALELTAPFEHLVINPSRYGGARSVLVSCRENLDDFWLVGTEKSFENITPNEKTNKNIVLTRDQIDKIRNGDLLNNYIPNLDEFDIVFYSFPSVDINCKNTKVVWSLGSSEVIHENIKYLICQNTNYQRPQLKNPQTQVFDFVLGLDIPEFVEYSKEDLIFQCTNHYSGIQSHIVAELCNRYKIKCIFAGPIDEDYPLLDYIDNKNTFYLGQISEYDKIRLLKNARFFTALYTTPAHELPLGPKQALAHGCGLLTTELGGHAREIVKDGENGFIIGSEAKFRYAWDNRNQISQKTCYNSIKHYSTENMINSLVNIFEKITKKVI